MTLKQFIYLLPRLVKYNLKIIFAGKFIWFLLAAFLFFAYFMFQIAWSRSEVNEGVVYNLLMLPCVLLVFYPAVFGIQNDEDSRILEILFGIPDYKYKVWGVRLLMIYVAIFVILIVFSWLATLLLYPVNLLEMSAQLMFPILFFGNLAFMFSTITRSGNGTAAHSRTMPGSGVHRGADKANRQPATRRVQGRALFEGTQGEVQDGALNGNRREKSAGERTVPVVH